MREFKIISLSIFGFLASNSQSHSQSAIETAMFILTGHEVIAPEQKWSGTLESARGEKMNYNIAALDGCRYEFTNLDDKDKFMVSVDFSRVTALNLKPKTAGNQEINFLTEITGTNAALCFYPKKNNKICFDSGALVNVLPNGRIGNINTDTVLQKSAEDIFARKQLAYN